MFFIEEKTLKIGDSVKINKGKYAGSIGEVVFASSRAAYYIGCWNYVIRFTTPKGKQKKRWFGQYDLDKITVTYE